MKSFRDYKPTLECDSCGYTLHGDMPSIVMTCDDCIQYEKEEAVESCPDGWTCVECGDEYSSKTVDVKDYYVTYTKEGTLCRKCQKGDSDE